jgi:hypothetical protein
MYTFGVDNGQNVQSGLSWLFVDNINDAYRVFGLEPVDANNHWWQITVTWTCPEGTTSYDWDVLNDHPFVPTGSDYVPVSSDGSLEGSSTAFSTSQQSYQFQWDFDKQA